MKVYVPKQPEEKLKCNGIAIDGNLPVKCGPLICGHEASCNGTCVCRALYESKTNPTFPTQIQWCEKQCTGSDFQCPGNTTCMRKNSREQALCQCSLGFNKTRFGQCIDADECSDNPGICGNHSTCINTVGNYTCRCHEGYVDVHGTGRFCEKDPTPVTKPSFTEDSTPDTENTSKPLATSTVSLLETGTQVPVGPMAAGIGGAILFIFILVIVVTVIYRRRSKRCNNVSSVTCQNEAIETDECESSMKNVRGGNRSTGGACVPYEEIDLPTVSASNYLKNDEITLATETSVEDKAEVWVENDMYASH
ncbi:transmembrane matrix receptor MUP-4-like isoform X2 [Liolophura sinensis]|uniref:transmembrane matrix receptor MUP-4-like isoform X2 n=1 Tax=Liolophura sinensis TaxID=3198878 RepID=UPI003158E25E